MSRPRLCRLRRARKPTASKNPPADRQGRRHLAEWADGHSERIFALPWSSECLMVAVPKMMMMMMMMMMILHDNARSHTNCCHGPHAPLAMGGSGISTLVTRYESMRLQSLCHNERTTARDRCETRDEIIRAIGRSIHADCERRLPKVKTKVLKADKCYTSVNKVLSEISNCCH